MQKDTIKIDVNSIPEYVRDDLTAATLEPVPIDKKVL